VMRSNGSATLRASTLAMVLGWVWDTGTSGIP
jgi:hypothetical protein